MSTTANGTGDTGEVDNQDGSTIRTIQTPRTILEYLRCGHTTLIDAKTSAGQAGEFENFDHCLRTFFSIFLGGRERDSTRTTDREIAKITRREGDSHHHDNHRFRCSYRTTTTVYSLLERERRDALSLRECSLLEVLSS